MASTIKSNGSVQSNGYPPLRIRFYRPSDWEQVKPIFMDGVRAPLAAAVRHMYTWPWFRPVYGLVGGGLAWLGREVWNAANRLGLQAFRTEYPWGWMRLVGRGVIQNWTWKESAALGSIGIGLVTWRVIKWKVDQAFLGYAQMSLESDLKDIPEHYRMERVLHPEPNGRADCEDWRPKAASAFWVAEIGDEVVGCIGLGESFYSFNPRSLPSTSALIGIDTHHSPQTKGTMDRMAPQESYDA